MPRFFTICNGPILRHHGEPFVTGTLEEALEIIEAKFFDQLDFEDDRVAIYELPEEPGRAHLVWQFIGLYADLSMQGYAEDGEPLGIREEQFPQGRLLNHEETLYDELLPEYVAGNAIIEVRERDADRILDTLFDNARPLTEHGGIFMAGEDL